MRIGVRRIMEPTNIIERLVAAPAGSELEKATQARAEILRLSQASHDAVVTPKEAGGISHAERAALAERMARHNLNAELAAHYHECLEKAGANNALGAIASLASEPNLDNRLTAIVRFTDLVTLQPRDAQPSDIESLKQAGISEPDIVRLTELLAFVNYQVRVIAGLKLAGKIQ